MARSAADAGCERPIPSAGYGSASFGIHTTSTSVKLRDWKASYEVESGQQQRLKTYARYCAIALARAHARSGSASAIAGYLGKGDEFERAIEQFAVAYAAQNGLDYQALQQAEADGRIKVVV